MSRDYLRHLNGWVLSGKIFLKMNMDAKFWRKHESIATSQKVPLKAREWYLRWAKAFLL